VPSNLTSEQDQLAISLIRGFAMDAPLYAKSGHQGTAMSLAPLAHVLYSRILRHNPTDSTWINRDRFILSNGHASILQYSLLFLGGWGLTLDDIKQFRQWESLTPGHPEVGHTTGVEVTTGPLGQGFANAVGMAIAEEHLRSTHSKDAIDHHTFVIVGDGCLMEGVSHEAASLAGHLGLDHLVCIFDDNKITIDGSTDMTCSDDVAMRFRSYGWNVIEAGAIAEDCNEIEKVLNDARAHTGSPTLVVLSTQIGFPSPDFTNAHEAHGNPFTADHVSRTKKVMGIPDEPFWAPDDLVMAYRTHMSTRGQEAQSLWSGNLSDERVTSLMTTHSLASQSVVASTLPAFEQGASVATRQAFQKVLEATDEVLPHVLAGAADLTGNTGAKLSSQSGFSAQNRKGRQVFYGIREHAMGSALVGMALHGGVIPVGGTFFVFADYMRPAIRLAALSRARCVFVFSHDSVGVGEDGPTHQPVEHLASLRSIPGLQVIRPADENETAQAWLAAVTHDGPTALILSRQNLPVMTDGGAVTLGASIIQKATQPTATLVATGSELHVALGAAQALAKDSIQVNVVSMPCVDRFLALSQSQKQQIVPGNIPSISIEAGSTFGWGSVTTHHIGIDRFGASAPGGVVMEKLGISVDNVVARVKEALTA
jgi:transketolase